MGMRLAKQARLSLKGQWKGAVLAQWMVLAAGLFLLLLEVAALRLTGLGMETVSYTHLDVYKRQALTNTTASAAGRFIDESVAMTTMLDRPSLAPGTGSTGSSPSRKDSATARAQRIPSSCLLYTSDVYKRQAIGWRLAEDDGKMVRRPARSGGQAPRLQVLFP